MIPFKCVGCGKEGEYDPKQAVLLHARRESEAAGRPVHYHVFRCPSCGARNEKRPPPEAAAPPTK